MKSLELAKVETLNPGTDVDALTDRLREIKNPTVIGWFALDQDGAICYEIDGTMKKDALWAMEMIKINMMLKSIDD